MYRYGTHRHPPESFMEKRREVTAPHRRTAAF
jgi:hypothetical protein